MNDDLLSLASILIFGLMCLASFGLGYYKSKKQLRKDKQRENKEEP